MWSVPQYGGCSAAAGSPDSGSRPASRSFSSYSSTTPTQRASASPRNRRSQKNQAWNGQAFAKPSPLSSTAASSRSSSQVDLASRPGIGSRQRSGYGPLGSPYGGRGYGPLGMPYRPNRYGPPSGHEVISTHVRGSAGQWRRLPAPTRSLRSLVCSKGPSMMLIVAIGRLAGRCPSGEEAQPDVTLEARRGRMSNASVSRRSLLRRLPATLADDGEQEHTRLPSLADSHRDGRDPWGHPAQPQCARTTSETPTPSKIQRPDRGNGPPPRGGRLSPGVTPIFTHRGVRRARGARSRFLTGIAGVAEGVTTPPETAPESTSSRGRDGGETR